MLRVLTASVLGLGLALSLTPAARAACYKEGCKVRVNVNTKTKIVEVYVDGELKTKDRAAFGRRTEPKALAFDAPLTNRIYGADYKVLPNSPLTAPYAMFVSNFTMIYGEAKNQAHPEAVNRALVCNGIAVSLETAKQLNSYANEYGNDNIWVTIENK